MTEPPWRVMLRAAAMMTSWFLLLPALLWIWIYADFLVFKPRRVQTELFGHPIASPWALRSARNDCCILPLGDGELVYRYAISPELARQLVAECLRSEMRGGEIEPVPQGICLVRSKPFGKDGMKGGLSATLEGETIRIQVEWI